MQSGLTRVAIGGALVLVVGGCPGAAGLFGVTAEEQKQLQQLRGLQHAVSPALNQELGFLARAIGEALGMGLPTTYGSDIGPYLRMAPWPTVTALKSVAPLPVAGDSLRQEIGSLQIDPSRQFLQFSFNEGSANPPQTSAPYKITMARSLEATTGTLLVTTRTQNASFWKAGTGISGQPTSFGGMYFGRKYGTTQPSGISVDVSMSHGGKTSSAKVTLSQNSQGTSGALLPEISIQATMPRVETRLVGKVQASAISMSGDLTLTDDQGVGQALQVTALTLSGTSLKISLVGKSQAFQVDLTYDGKFSGEAKSTNPDLPRTLAAITGSKIKYVDRTAAEPWQ